MVNLCNWLYEAGVYVEVVLIAGQGQELALHLDPGIIIHIINRKSRFDLKAGQKIAKLIRNADIAHIHMRHNYRYTALIAKLLHIHTPLVFHDHYGKINLDQKVPAGFKSFAVPAWYIGVSQTLTSWAKANLHTPKEHIFLLENVVEAKPLSTHSKKKDIILVSNIKPQKNQLFALELLEHSNCTLDLYGGRQDENYALTLDEQIRNQGLSNRVQQFHHCSNIQEQLSGYKLGLHTSISETGPLVIIEYLAQGLPFLAYRTGEAADKIGKELPEFFLDHFEKEVWVERINALINNPPDRDKMNWVFEKYFSKQAYIEKCQMIYRRVLHS